jgi:hypothetical protein
MTFTTLNLTCGGRKPVSQAVTVFLQKVLEVRRIATKKKGSGRHLPHGNVLV